MFIKRVAKSDRYTRDKNKLRVERTIPTGKWLLQFLIFFFLFRLTNAILPPQKQHFYKVNIAKSGPHYINKILKSYNIQLTIVFLCTSL